MPRVKEEERRRAKRPKTRTGCRTCKIRRIKCDETKPHCRKCTSTGRRCDGYERSPEPRDTVYLPIAPPPPSTLVSEKERRAFHFFHHRTSPQIAGLLECDFWSRIVLQAAQADSAIRRAVVALASVHEDFEQAGDAHDRGNAFALQQYGLAIQEHLARLTTTVGDTPQSAYDVESYLASCIIFLCIEMLQSHYMSALSLIQRAVGLLRELDATRQQPSKSVWPLDVFEALLCRLQAQAIGLVGPAVFNKIVPPHIRTGRDVEMPAQFTSIVEAQKYLDFHRSRHTLAVLRSELAELHDQDGPAVSIHLEYCDIISRWSTAFNALRSALVGKDNLSERDRRALALLTLRQRLLLTSHQICHKYPSVADFEDMWESHLGVLEEVLGLAEFVMQRSTNSADVSSRASSTNLFANAHDGRHLFTLDIGLVDALYDIARGCRDPRIRRKAIGLLRMNPSREGLFDGVLAARVAHRVMELEEGAVMWEVKTAADIPAWARLRVITPKFSVIERQTVVTFSRGPVEVGGLKALPEVVETFQW